VRRSMFNAGIVHLDFYIYLSIECVYDNNDWNLLESLAVI
jgi:hypothetical protein